MAIRNNFAVYINGINLTPFCVNPIKWGNFLDEQLDEMYLSLRHGPFENIKPLSPVEIHFTNELYFGSTTVDTQTKIKRYLVANDNAEESPVGSKCYNHDLYLIEVTKFAECVVVDTLTFTNDLGRSYTNNPTAIVPQEGEEDLDIYKPQTPSTYVTPLPAGEVFDFVKCSSIFPYINGPQDSNIYTFKQTVYFNGNEEWSNTYIFDITGNSGQDIGYTTTLKPGTYLVEYTFNLQGVPVLATKIANYTFLTVENYYPLKKWTITDVINRLLDIAEPLRQGEQPRFILQGIDPDTGNIQPNTQAAQFNNILAPQFSFTKQTLRECLKEIGGVIHGEPRLDIVQDSEGNYYYEVSFDLYGQTDMAGIYVKPYIQKTVSQVIDSYASAIDSNAENLVNQLDKLAGVIVEPYAGGYKTVRTETMYARITDANMLIQTQYPIYTVEKLECGFVPNNSSISAPIDITPYLFESSIYNTQLSSYQELYPYSKAYGLMFTQGEKNITALNFKDPDAVSSSFFSEYAIINILRTATGNSSLEVTDYPFLAFRVTYTPFYNSRVGQTKVNYQDYPYAAALIYNQQSNVIESRYYGENLKGVIARLGNVDKSITYNLARISDIPQAGQMYDDDYYISTVAVEYLPTYIKCTIGLSKDFNRLSQYIGISSVKRYSEVSQGQAVERNTLWKEYIVVGDEEQADTDCDVNDEFLSAMRDTFLQTGSYTPLTHASAYGGTYNQPLVTDGSSTPAPSGSVTAVQAYPNTPLIQVTTTLPNNTSVTATINFTCTTPSGNQPGTATVTFLSPTETINASEYVSGAYNVSGISVSSATYIQQNYPLPLVSLPIISSAFGNSIAFSWAYEDNYSAGAISQYAAGGTGTTEVTGWFQNNYQYTDYYGRMYYYNYTLHRYGAEINSFTSQEDIGTALPQGVAGDTANGFINTYAPRILRKDNREKLQCNFQVDFISNRKGLIIGSALAAYCPLVRGEDSSLAAKLYIFDEPLNKFINHVDGSLNINGGIESMQGYNITVSLASNGQFTVSADNFPIAGASWAICTQQTLGEPYIVEDEQGDTETVQDVKGGDVLIAQNGNFAAGAAFPTVYFTKKREVFNKNVWIANR